MSFRVTATASISPAGRRTLAQMQAPEATETLNAFLRIASQQVQRNVTTKQIRRSSKGRVHPTRLTSRTGELRRSIAVDFRPLSAAIGTALVYGPPHEFGSSKQGLPPRPFLRPALDEEAKGFEALLHRLWRRKVYGA